MFQHKRKDGCHSSFPQPFYNLKLKEIKKRWSMSELRKDYLLDHYVIINEKRSLRPSDFSRAPIVKAKVDFFAPGNEHLTPEEIGRISKGKSWQMRWFENKFPILDMQKHPLHSHRLYREIALQGHHEILVETPSETDSSHHSQKKGSPKSSSSTRNAWWQSKKRKASNTLFYSRMKEKRLAPHLLIPILRSLA